MTGVYIATGQCLVCRAVFNFNPHLVPSIPIGTTGRPDPDGKRQPLCRTCAEGINEARERMGLELFAITDEAYEPTETL